MSMIGEEVVPLSPDEEMAFVDMVGNLESTVEEDTLVAGGLTSVLDRARAAAETQSEQISAGISDVNAAAAAFQSSLH